MRIWRRISASPASTTEPVRPTANAQPAHAFFMVLVHGTWLHTGVRREIETRKTLATAAAEAKKAGGAGAAGQVVWASGVQVRIHALLSFIVGCLRWLCGCRAHSCACCLTALHSSARFRSASSRLSRRASLLRLSA